MKSILFPLFMSFYSPRVGFHDFSITLISIHLLQSVIKFALILEIDFIQNSTFVNATLAA